MSVIEIHKNSITSVHTDAIVNAANSGLRQGSGVCGDIFEAAGANELKAECKKIGCCEAGNAVITSGCNLIGKNGNKYIIHAVGPDCRVMEENNNRETLLYNAHYNSLQLAKSNGCRSITFPLISTGVYRYPIDEAWSVALKACHDFIKNNDDYSIKIVFVGRERDILNIGKKILDELSQCNKSEDNSKEQEFVFFWKEDEADGYLSNWFYAPFTIEGIRYWCVEQYMMSKKALLFHDLPIYDQIMQSQSQHQIKSLGKLVHNFDSTAWSACKEEIVYNACRAKFMQNACLKQDLLSTEGKVLAEASPNDKIWGIGMTATSPDCTDTNKWQGQSLLGKILMRVRQDIK